MRFDTTLVSSFLFASAVLAGHRRDHQYRPINYIEQCSDTSSDGVGYSSNWSGALWEKNNGTFTSVVGTFTVPIPSGRNGSAASVWVGIDGDSCTSSILQTGIDFVIADNRTSYRAWYEWYPDDAHPLDLPVSAGNVIRANVTAISATSGVAVVENLTSGQSAVKYLHSSSPLCRQNAEWIVEDFGYGNGALVPFANFSTVTFTDAVATGSGTRTYTPDGAAIDNIQQNGKTLTSVSVDGSSVTIQYV